MISNFLKNKKIIAGLLLVFGTAAAIFYFNSDKILSQIEFYRRSSASEYRIEQARKAVKDFRAADFPKIVTKKLVTRKEIPEVYKNFLTPFQQPQFWQAEFADQSQGWLIQEGSEKNLSCPVYGESLGKNIQMTLQKKTPHLIRTDYEFEKNQIFTETRQAAFACQIDIVIKPIIDPRKKMRN